MAQEMKSVTPAGPPNEFVDPKIKTNKDYGLQYVRHIWSQYIKESWWQGRKSQWILNRKYAEGLQSMDKYKNRLDITDSSWVNLDMNPIPIIPKYVDNIVGKLTNQGYKILCDILDPSSRTEEDEAMKEMKTKMFLKQYNEEVTSMTGIPMFSPNEYVPEDNEELDVYFQLNYKPSLAVAMELAIDFVLKNNEFQDIREQLIRDFITCKTAFCRQSYDKNFDIKVSYEDPVDVVVPYSKHDDYRNIPYFGVIRKITIGQLASQTTELSEEDLYNIAKTYAGKLNNANWNGAWSWQSYDGYYQNNFWGGRPYDDFFINVLEFEFLSLNKWRYEEKRNDRNGMYFSEKSFNYKPKEDKKYKKEVINKDVQERYEGCWVIDSSYLYNYKKSANVPREKVQNGYNTRTSLSLRGISPNMYDMQNKSIVERMIPHADQMTLLHQKMQQFVIKATPPGIWIDIDAANEAIASFGGTIKTPLDLIKVYNQTGSFVGTRKDDKGDPINGKTVEVLPNGMGDVSGLITMFQTELQMINDIIGYNSATDGSTPDVNALVGTQKLAVQSTNNTLRPINNSYVKLVRMVAKDVSLMIQDKFEYGGGLDGFERAIGKNAINIIEIGKKIPLCEYGITIEFLPDEVERAEVDEYIKMALTTVPPQISLADAVVVRQVLKSNVKLATQMLVLKQKKYQEARIKEGEAQSRMNAEQQAMAAQAAAQSEIEKEAALLQMLQQKTAIELQKELELMKQAHVLKMEEIALQNQGKVAVADKQNDGKVITTAMTAAATPPPAPVAKPVAGAK